MMLLERYLFRRALKLTLGALASLVLIVWIVQALQRIDIVRSTASAAGNVIWIALTLIPELAAGVVPFAVLIGAIHALNSMNADSERAVIAASGASDRVVVRPILLLGLIAALVTLFNSHVLGPASQRAFYNGLRTINADAITVFLQPGRFEQIQKGLVISVGDVRGSEISELFLSDQRDEAIDLAYFAKGAQIVEKDLQSYLLLYNGQLHRKSTLDGAVSIIQFQTYAVDLANLRPASSGDWVHDSERTTLQLFYPDLNDPSFQARPHSLVKEVTERFTDWLYPFVFAIVAVAAAGQPRTNRRGPGPAMVIGLSIGLCVKALGFVALTLIDRNPSLAVLAAALPVGTGIGAAAVIRSGVDLSSLPIFDRIQHCLSDLAKRMTARGVKAPQPAGR